MVTYLEEFRQNFRLADALDIAVIAVLIYAAWAWFKQSASRSLVIGVSVLTVLYFLASSFDMYLTTLVFQTAFAALLVVLVVLFQEEIRRMFERVAGWGTLRDLRPKTTALVDEVDSLVEAAFTLAGQKTGALIVLEGREPLARHIDGGIELSGRLSKPLLFSIFDPSSAGHDGAVIIQRGRIEKFGAHLPISKNHKEIRGRGTRHSAALGLCEQSDALIIVVSEERGVVSVAENARLVEMKTASDLKTHVERFLEDRFPRRIETTWKKLIAHDARGKLVALVLAILAWFMLAFSVEKVQTSIVVPIEYRQPERVQIDASRPVEALVTLSGSERAFRMLDRRVLKISLDLSAVEEDDEVIHITAGDVRVPPNLTVDRIQPDEIRVQLMVAPQIEQAPPANATSPE